MSPVAFSLIAFIVLTAAGGAHLVELAVGRARRGARMERLPQ